MRLVLCLETVVVFWFFDSFLEFFGVFFFCWGGFFTTLFPPVRWLFLHFFVCRRGISFSGGGDVEVVIRFGMGFGAGEVSCL